MEFLSHRHVDLAAIKALWPWAAPRPCPWLADSIQSIGLIEPLIVLPEGAEYKLISGYARLAVLAGLGWESVPALIVANRPLAELLEIALAENVSRGWNASELAKIWKFMQDTLPEAEALRLAAYLNLDKSPKIRAWAAAAAALPAAALQALAEEALDLESAARLAAWDAESLGVILNIFETLAPSKQKKRQWLDWLEDLGRREQARPADILQNPEIQAALTVTDGRRAAAEEAARYCLWRRRHPLLAGLSERRRAQIKALALPEQMKLEADPTFEDLKFSLNLTFSTHDELKALAHKVQQLAEHPALAAMLKEGSQ